MKANEFLEAGLKHMQDRASTYDNPQGERSIGATVEAFKAVTGDGLMNTEERGWLFMLLLKAVRSQQGDFKADNYEDLAAYGGLMGEAAHSERATKAQEWPPEDRIDAIGQNGGDPHYDELDMSDPANWREGDALKFMDVDCELYTQYDVYQILDIEGSTMKILCDKDASGLIFSTWSMCDLDCFQWHSRPSPEQ